MPTFQRPTILMCPPEFYGIEYEINPWMSRSRQSDPAVARQEWDGLRGLLEGLGADILQVDPVQGLPDFVFTANAGLIWRDKVFVSRFRHAARTGESPLFAQWFEQHGFETEDVPPGKHFEGAGDALFCGDTLYAGYLIRSDAAAVQWVASRMGCRVIPLQLVDQYYYHLDTCFCPLNATDSLYYPPAFDDYARRALAEHVPTLIPVEQPEAARFGCNAIVVGKDVVVNSGCPRLEQSLCDHGYFPHSTPLGEFIKAGGSAKCLTLRLDGEDAAIWP